MQSYVHARVFDFVCLGHKMASENRSISRASYTTYSSTEAWVTDQNDQVIQALLTYK